jgi:mannose-6-phosphate isomerase-like protein (cupin superfamily)
MRHSSFDPASALPIHRIPFRRLWNKLIRVPILAQVVSNRRSPRRAIGAIDKKTKMIAMQQPYLNTREDGGYRFMGVPTLTRATRETTNGAFGLIEHWEMPVGFASPYHTHRREDECFYILEGKVAFVCGGEWLQAAGPGAFVYGPRNIAHGFRAIGERPVRMLVMCTPAGFERFILDQATPITEPPSPPDMERLMTLAARHEIEIHGPLPEVPAEFDR